MKGKLKVIAPYLSILGLLVWAAIPALLWLIRQNGGTPPSWLGWALAAFGLVLVLAWPLLCPEDLRRMAGKRQTRYGGNALVMVLAVIGILVAINFLSSRRYWTKDLTTNKQFSVSRQTLQILDGLKDTGQTVSITGIFSPVEDSAAGDVTKLLDRYRQRSDALTYQRIDPAADRAAVLGLVDRLKLDENSGLRDRVLVVESGDKSTIVSSLDEQGITEAIVKVTRDRTPVLAFTVGHGEYDPNGTGAQGYGTIRQRLERDGYKVETLNLATVSDTIKADAVVIAGPQRPFLPQETSRLAEFIQGGGSALLLLDAGVDTGLDPVLQPWAISPDDDVVLQANALGMASSEVTVQGEDYGFHPVTQGVNQLFSVIPSARSFGVGQPVSTTFTTTPLIEVKQNAWGETDLAGLSKGQGAFDAATDKSVPLNLALAAEGGENVGRMVLFGSALMASDSWLQQFQPGAVANADLVPNAINWLTRDENLISIRPTEPDDRSMAPPTRPYLLLFVLVALIPLTIFGIGLWLYWRRR